MSYTREMIADKLATDNNWLFKGILAIYARQTASEQSYGETVENNGIGFNGADANILSGFAVQIQKWNDTPVSQRRFPIPLSEKQRVIAQKKMKKYAGQLALIANANRPAGPPDNTPQPAPRTRRTRVTPPVVAAAPQSQLPADFDR